MCSIITDTSAKQLRGCKKAMADHYTYRVTWSAEDEEYVGLCAEFPSLSWLAPTQEEAFSGIRVLVADCVVDMQGQQRNAAGTYGRPHLQREIHGAGASRNAPRPCNKSRRGRRELESTGKRKACQRRCLRFRIIRNHQESTSNPTVPVDIPWSLAEYYGFPPARE